MYRKIQSDIPLITYSKGSMNYSFLETGDIYEFRKENFIMNQFCGNLSDGAISNIYLRIWRENGEPEVYPLRGKQSGAVLYRSTEGLCFENRVKDVFCKVEFVPADENLWFWNITLEGNHEECDLIYVQDTGVGDKGAILNNLLYVSQYVDHKIMENEYGYVIGSRQNMSQGGRNPYLQQGCLGKRIIGFATDAMQIYGRKSKLTHIPEALYQERLPNEKYQFELSCIALQTERFAINGRESFSFYGYFIDNYLKKAETIQKDGLIRESRKRHLSKNTEQPVLQKKVPYKDCFGERFSSEAFTKEETDTLFPYRKLEEYEDGALLSFFTENHRHVVLQEKEVRMERPHGHILLSVMSEHEPDKELLTATTYMYGVFCSQAVIGNVDSNPLLTNAKGLLNLHQEYGLRIFVKRKGKYCLLTMPAAYEMGLNYSRWYYKLEGDMLEITAFMTAKENTLVINVKSRDGRRYEFLVTMSLALGNGGTAETAQLKLLKNGISLKPDEDKSSMIYYPGLEYYITFTGGSAEISDDRIFFEDGRTRNALLLTGKTEGAGFEMELRAVLEKKQLSGRSGFVCEEEERKYLEFYDRFLNGFKLRSRAHSKEAQRLNEICYWYLHDAMIHYAAPHGLEQSGGAAWGTRDVCQGPVELFLATGHFELVRNTLLEIFAHQSQKTGEWPQWFMFDKYPYAADDCHGDVVFWPLKCVGDYIEASQDDGILLAEVPYADGESAALLEHMKAAFENIKKRFLFGTYLISYAGGDWDDTLQPANKELKERMCSAWTQGLAYQSLLKLKGCVYALDRSFYEELSGACEGIRRDFCRYLIKDGVIAGFAFLRSEKEISYMLHPLDDHTGLKYRLLPLTRSIIAELVTVRQAQINDRIIDEKLSFPDGVRLMDKPAEYDGGISRNFVRAEQATNVGREIGLQYVHAHIRYVEAMAKLGNANKVIEGLLEINPICIQDTVKNADLRQSNTYFSSSEGDFKDRYDFREHFELLKTGGIKTKGGWRIYSSGPGIYLSRLLRDMLGIKTEKDSVIIDPVISPEWDGLSLQYRLWGKEYTFTYRVKEKGCGVAAVRAGEKELPDSGSRQQAYRGSGSRIKREWLEALDTCNIEICLY